TNKISPGVGFLTCIIKIFCEYQLRKASSNEIPPYPPFLRTVQSSKKAWSIHVEHKQATRAQAMTDASQYLCGVLAGHLSKTPEDERHGVKHRLVLHGADVALHEFDCQACLERSPLGCSNGCWPEIDTRHQRAASRHRQTVTPAPTGNVQNA